MQRHALIRASLEALSLARAPLWLPAGHDTAGFVVTLHHVRPARPSPFDPNGLLSITPDFLDNLLGHFIARGWRFVSVDELVTDVSRVPSPRRIAVTLDDGYRNNMEHALPVFRKHAVPFTIFVCPGFAERTSELWWEALERIIAKVDSLAPPGEGTAPPHPTRTPAEKQAAFELWRNWLTTVADETRQRVAIRALAAIHALDLAALTRELVMDWRETRAIAADPLCSIGAHTMTHAALARLTPEAASREIAGSMEKIAAEIGTRPRNLAFPYGYPSAAGPREARLAEKAGLLASFTTQPGYVPVSGARHGLPRVSVNGLFQRVRYMEVLLSPGLWRLRDQIRTLR
jgi:peptidoglycan/xylan/chitin deacetylase (PgdA/CDA1 family)